jgi:hypothetical protein
MVGKKKGSWGGGDEEGREGRGSGEVKIIGGSDNFEEDVSRIEGKLGDDVSMLESSRRNLDFTPKNGGGRG